MTAPCALTWVARAAKASKAVKANMIVDLGELARVFGSKDREVGKRGRRPSSQRGEEMRERVDEADERAEAEERGREDGDRGSLRRNLLYSSEGDRQA